MAMLTTSQMDQVRAFQQRFGNNPWHTKLHNILSAGTLGHQAWLEVTQCRLAAQDMVKQAEAAPDKVRRDAEGFLEACDHVLKLVREQIGG